MATALQYQALVDAMKAVRDELVAAFGAHDSQIAFLEAQIAALEAQLAAFEEQLANQLTAAEEDSFLAELNTVLVDLQALVA